MRSPTNDFLRRQALKPKTSTVPASRCPHCGKLGDQATNAKARVPKPGSISVCIGCSGIAVFDEKMHLRHPTDAENEEFKKIPELKVYVDIAKKIRGDHSKGH